MYATKPEQVVVERNRGIPGSSEMRKSPGIDSRRGASHAEGIFCRYSDAGDRASARRSLATRGGRAVRYQPKCGSQMGEVLSRDGKLRAQASGREHVAFGATCALAAHARRKASRFDA